MPKTLTKPFILVLLLLVIVGCYFVFRPFLTEILVAAILASIFYKPFEILSRWLKGRRQLAAFLMCIILLLIIIIPAVKIVIYAGEKSVDAYTEVVGFFNNHSVNDVFKLPVFEQGALRYLNLGNLDLYNDTIKGTLLNIFQQSSNWLLSGATLVLKETTGFIISLILIILATYFFFVDGKKMLQWLMYLSPLPDDYDRAIFDKFRSVSYTTIASTFVASLAQGIAGAIGFAIVGFPALLAFVVVALLSFLPIGSTIFYVPMGLYYLLIGDIWQGIFILVWGILIIGTVDNIIRAYMIKGKAEINPMFVLFSILGGIVLFGFWGVVLGPLIVALAVTVFHLYSLEFGKYLEGEEPMDDKAGEPMTKKIKKIKL